MKSFAFLVFGWNLIFINFVWAGDSKPCSFTTLRGEKFENVVIIGQTPLEISVQTATGVTHVPYADLAPDLRAQFGYDQARAIAYYKLLIETEKQRIATEKNQAVAVEQAARAKRQAELDNVDAVNEALREYQYLQENSGRLRGEALKAALRERYLQTGK